MIALKYCPSYDQFIVLAQDIEDIDYDWLFQEIAVKYPDRYADAYRVIQQNQIGKKKKQEYNKNKEHDEEPTQSENVDNDIYQDYQQQYKNDNTMKQVGEDIESDDEHTTMTVRNGNEWTKVRVKRA
mgnify:FL=1